MSPALWNWRAEAYHKSIVAEKFPEWLKRPWPSGDDFAYTRDLTADLGLHTVCQSARCPNQAECWKNRTATFMLMGNACTRSCRYCSVPAGAPEMLDEDEPAKIAEAIRRLELEHAVLTAVTRDDLPDGGAAHIAATIHEVKRVNPDTSIEMLVPDFLGEVEAIHLVLDSRPEIFSHNIETTRPLYPVLRGNRFDYEMAIGVLRTAANYSDHRAIVKSAMMVGHGETFEDVESTLHDLYEAGCHTVSIGQYMRPSSKQRAVAEYVHPGRFAAYEELAYNIGFRFAVAGPFVRSSYRSEDLMKQPFAREILQLGEVA